MTGITRRRILHMGGIVAAFSLAPFGARAGGIMEIRMQGRQDGSHVWFDPIGLRIEPGQTVRWINHDPSNSHTSTAYHPDNFDRPRRIPYGVSSWNSDYLLPGETFATTLSRPGVYDYYCVPHEHAGMVGRIIVGQPGPEMAGGKDGLPQAALDAFPSVEEIMRKGVVRRA